MKEHTKKKCYPNEFGMLFDYNYIIILERNKGTFTDNLKYIGNYEITYPKDCFHADNYDNTTFSFLSLMDINKFINKVIESYEDFNLKKSKYFNIDTAEKGKYSWNYLLKSLPYGELYVQQMMKTHKLDNVNEEDTLTDVTK